MSWTVQKQINISNLNAAISMQHQAASFLAMVGKHLVDEMADDSHTNLSWNSKKQMLVGRTVKANEKIKVGLNLEKLILFILNKRDEIVGKLNLDGLSKPKVFTWLKENIQAYSPIKGELINSLHFNIPEMSASEFKMFNSEVFEQATVQRKNSAHILESIRKEQENIAPIKTWPHHFDTATFIPVRTNANNELTASIGLGYAINDSMINEPYYYLSFWSSDNAFENIKFSALEHGHWMGDKWNGAVLRQSEINSLCEKDQFRSVYHFFIQGMKIIMA